MCVCHFHILFFSSEEEEEGVCSSGLSLSQVESINETIVQ